jgi:hypothetical protein
MLEWLMNGDWKILEGNGHNLIKVFMEAMKKTMKYQRQIGIERPPHIGI